MARSDLVLALAQAGNAGDKKKARVVTEAIIAEERAKQHTVLAEKLSKVVHLNGNNGNDSHLVTPSSDGSNRGRDFVVELVPRRQLDDVILPAITRRAVDRLVQEQQRADLLRAHGVEPRNRIFWSAHRAPARRRSPKRSPKRFRFRSSSSVTSL